MASQVSTPRPSARTRWKTIRRGELMKGKIILMSLALALASVGVACADSAGNAASHVFVVVDPNISILPGLAHVSLGSIQTGSFPGRIAFRIDANTEAVQFYAVVSDLYKGDVC